jgi:hypothetical protein
VHRCATLFAVVIRLSVSGVDAQSGNRLSLRSVTQVSLSIGLAVPVMAMAAMKQPNK